MTEEQENKAVQNESPSKKGKEHIDSSNSEQRQFPSAWDLLDVLWWI